VRALLTARLGVFLRFLSVVARVATEISPGLPVARDAPALSGPLKFFFFCFFFFPAFAEFLRAFAGLSRAFVVAARLGRARGALAGLRAEERKESGGTFGRPGRPRCKKLLGVRSSDCGGRSISSLVFLLDPSLEEVSPGTEAASGRVTEDAGVGPH